VTSERASSPIHAKKPFVLQTWAQIVEAFDLFATRRWAFRDHESSEWMLETSLEREFGADAADVEQEVYWHFVRRAPRWLQGVEL
jgi:hypothetical protein